MSISIKKLFVNKKVVAIAAAGALTLGIGGAAFAYFTSTGSATGTGSVGTDTSMGRCGRLCDRHDVPRYWNGHHSRSRITSNGGGNFRPYTSLTATLAAKNGDITSGGVRGCRLLGELVHVPPSSLRMVAGSTVRHRVTNGCHLTVTVTLTMD